MNIKVVGLGIIAIMVIVGGTIFFGNTGSKESQLDKIDSQYEKDLKDEQSKSKVIEKEEVIKKRVETPKKLEKIEEKKVVQAKRAETKKELVIPNGFKKAPLLEVKDINNNEFNENNFTKIYDNTMLNVYIDNFLKKNVKSKIRAKLLVKIKHYIKNGTVVIKKDKDYNVYLEIVDYNNVKLLNIGDNLAKSSHIYHFEFNKAKLKESEDVNLFLRDLDIAIQEADAKNLVLVGYTDSVGNKDYNTFLSYKRAHALSSKIEKYDIGVKYVIRGEANPIATNKTAQGRAKNRRIEIFLGF